MAEDFKLEPPKELIELTKKILNSKSIEELFSTMDEEEKKLE